MEEDHGRSRGPQHTPAGPHAVGGEEPGSVLWTEDPVREARGRGGGKGELRGIVMGGSTGERLMLGDPLHTLPCKREGDSMYWRALPRSHTEKSEPPKPQKAFKV